jgi:hypothetical protein
MKGIIFDISDQKKKFFSSFFLSPLIGLIFESAGTPFQTPQAILR